MYKKYFIVYHKPIERRCFMIKEVGEMRLETREKMRGGEGNVVIRHFFEKKDFTAEVRLCAQLNLEPGSSIGMHEHSGEDEIYIVLRGTGLLDDGIVKKKIKAGDAVLTGNGQSHSVVNDGNESLEMIAVIAQYPAGQE